MYKYKQHSNRELTTCVTLEGPLEALFPVNTHPKRNPLPSSVATGDFCLIAALPMSGITWNGRNSAIPPCQACQRPVPTAGPYAFLRIRHNVCVHPPVHRPLGGFQGLATMGKTLGSAARLSRGAAFSDSGDPQAPEPIHTGGEGGQHQVPLSCRDPCGIRARRRDQHRVSRDASLPTGATVSGNSCTGTARGGYKSRHQGGAENTGSPSDVCHLPVQATGDPVLSQAVWNTTAPAPSVSREPKPGRQPRSDPPASSQAPTVLRRDSFFLART